MINDNKIFFYDIRLNIFGDIINNKIFFCDIIYLHLICIIYNIKN
jgi:hypothetical protein